MFIVRKTFPIRQFKRIAQTASLSCAATKESNQYVRNAQAAEIFRSSFYASKNGENSIPVEDLDQLVVRDNVRPSIFVNALEFTGLGLGLVSRFVPESISKSIAEAVEDAAVQQFNDNIRDMQLRNIDDVDVKETLKYHRELRGEEASDTKPDSTMPAVDAKNALTQIIYHSLKFSTKY